MDLENMTKDELIKHYRIRKLTPKEVFRLMDVTDEDYEKMVACQSNTILYKTAGNSIVVNVIVSILGQLFENKENIYKDHAYA